MEQVIDRIRDRMERKESLDDNTYWGNLFMLLFLTWAILLYVFTPPATDIQVSFETILIFLVISGYSLLLFNQTEILRSRVNELQDRVDAMNA
jgi:hypothetical protein